MALTKAPILDRTEATNILKGFLDVFQHFCNESKLPLATEFDRYLSRNIQVTSNGRLIARNLTEYLNRFERFEKRYSHCEVTVFKEDTLVFDQHIVCHYKAELNSKNGQKVQLYMMAIATIEDHKIVTWKQVVHERGSEKWEA